MPETAVMDDMSFIFNLGSASQAGRRGFEWRRAKGRPVEIGLCLPLHSHPGDEWGELPAEERQAKADNHDAQQQEFWGVIPSTLPLGAPTSETASVTPQNEPP